MDRDAETRKMVEILPPKWVGIMPIFEAVILDGTDKGKRELIPELRIMAALADERNKFARELATLDDKGDK